MNTLIAGFDTRKVGRGELALVPTPEATPTHQPISHEAFASEVEMGLALRGIEVTSQEYAVSHDGMRMFGMMVTSLEMEGVHYAVGLRNSNDKSMKLGVVAGCQVIVCSNMAFLGEFHALTAKHTSGFNLTESCDVALGRIQRGIAGVGDQVRMLKGREISDTLAREVIYDAFVPKSGMRLPKQVMEGVHLGYFEPDVDEFRPRTAWSPRNSFTSALKELKPMRQFQETAKLTPFLLRTLGLD